MKTIQEILRRVKATGLMDEILVVDDGSQGCTREVLARIDEIGQIKVIWHERNQGKGTAVRTGITNATGELAHRVCAVLINTTEAPPLREQLV